jgi:adenylate cyclase
MGGLGATLRSLIAYARTGWPPGHSIPARVLAEIDRREAAAEHTIGWVQLAFVSFFVLLYALAPRAEGSAGENFVPMTLAAYFAFTVFRVALSYRITIPSWFLVISMVVDVALLCGLIFSFHIQYAQPAAFYLKAPTMIYFFIFISLRVLRFDPRYVLTSGVIAVAGWMAMVAYALTTDMGEMRITRNYVEYLTSNSILIGAEIDKILTLVGVTLILSFAQFRARKVLLDAIQSHSAADDLSQFFAPEVADLITQSDALPGAGKPEIRAAAIMFVDVRGFTRTARGMPPEAVMAALACYQDIALREIEVHGGRVDKFMGDGILATFGAVQPNETHAADGLRAATAVIAALDAASERFGAIGWPVPFNTGAAVAAGEVTVGVVGAQGRFEFTVIGNAVNLAAKLEAANKMQGSRILTDGPTFRLAQAQGYAGDVPPMRRDVAIAGLLQSVDLVVLA